MLGAPAQHISPKFSAGVNGWEQARSRNRMGGRGTLGAKYEASVDELTAKANMKKEASTHNPCWA